MNPTLNRSSSQSLSMVALFAALMAVMGLIPKIDLPFGVPITLQSLGVMLAGCLLGARRGLQSMALFLLAVAVGLPLLSGGRGGLGVFMAPSAGYLVGYALAAGVTGALMARLPTQTPMRAAISASSCATKSFIKGDPSVVGKPAALERSLMACGMPCIHPREAPRASSASHASASASKASSGRSDTSAL